MQQSKPLPPTARLVLCVALVLPLLTLISCGGSTAPLSQMAGSTSSPAPTPTPSTGNGATVIDNIEDSSNWLTCGACGNDGGVGSTPHSSVTPDIATPSEDGTSTQFSIAATVPFTNTYWYMLHPVVGNQFSALTYEFDLYIPSGLEDAPQAIEFECQQILGGWIYNFAFQADYGRNLWRVFNYGAKAWESTGIPLQRFSPGTWHHLVAEYHSDASTHTVFHDALTVDGTRFPVNMTHAAFFSGANDQFTNAFQLDSNGQITPYSVYLDKMKITYK